MARDAVPQAQELPQERFLDRAEQRHVRAILAAGQYGAARDQQQFMQIMAGIILPRVNDLGKAGDEFFHGRASTLNPRLESSHASPSNPRLQPPAPYAIALPPMTRIPLPACRAPYPGGSRRVPASITSPLTWPSPFPRRVGIRIFTFEMLWGGRWRDVTLVAGSHADGASHGTAAR